MPKPVRPYSRVYWEAVDDPKFADVWDDDARLACWLRLLIAADMAWPSSATLYHGIRVKALRVLVDAGLVDIQGSGRYRIHGLDKERAARSEAGKDAINTRWHGSPGGLPPYPGDDSGGSTNGIRPYPVGSTEGIPSQDETRKDETRQVTPTPPSGVRMNPRATGMNPRALGTNPRAVAARAAAARKDALTALHLSYQRHEITEDEWKARAAAVRGDA